MIQINDDFYVSFCALLMLVFIVHDLMISKSLALVHLSRGLNRRI